MIETPRSVVQVLIADPDVIGRSACRKLVASRGLVVAEAVSRELTLRWLEQVRPRLLVLDLGLAPELDLLQQVVSLHPKVDVVMLCAAARVEWVRARARERALGAYVRDIWGKPLDPKRISAVLQAVFPPAKPVQEC
jgi:DNA-binding NtrC family response regulator